MAYFRCGGGGVPASVKTDMNAVLNKKFGTSTDYPPADWAPTVNLMGPLPEKTQASASVCAFEDGADDVPTKSLIVTIPASLSGVSSVTETQTGRNLLPNKTYQRNANTLRLGTDTLDGRLSLKASTYALSLTSDVAIGTLVYTIGGTSTNITFTSSGTRYYGSFTLSADTDDIFIHVYKSGGITAENVSDFMLEYGSTAHAYEPYQTPTTYTASLGRTIYGGEVDIITGEGSETWAIIDMGDLTWTYDSTYSRFISSSLPDCIKIDTARTTPILCSAYQVISDGRPLSQVPDKSIYLSFHSSGSPLTDAFVHDSDYTDATAFKTAVTGQKIVYQLKDSARSTFTFDGQEVPTRLGYNAFWSDEGDTEVTYRADIDLLLGGN